MSGHNTLKAIVPNIFSAVFDKGYFMKIVKRILHDDA
jgi:hypothetical protein